MTSSNGSKGTRLNIGARDQAQIYGSKSDIAQLVDSVVLDTSLLQMLHRQDV